MTYQKLKVLNYLFDSLMSYSSFLLILYVWKNSSITSKAHMCNITAASAESCQDIVHSSFTLVEL